MHFAARVSGANKDVSPIGDGVASGRGAVTNIIDFDIIRPGHFGLMAVENNLSRDTHPIGNNQHRKKAD